LGLELGLGHLLLVQSLGFHGPELRAVALQDLNEIALRLNGRALLDDEQGHQSVGSNENYGE